MTMHTPKYDVINLIKCFFNLINKDEIDIVKNGNQILLILIITKKNEKFLYYFQIIELI